MPPNKAYDPKTARADGAPYGVTRKPVLKFLPKNFPGAGPEGPARKFPWGVEGGKNFRHKSSNKSSNN